MWVLILSELAVFGAGLLAFLATRLTDPTGFAEAQSHLHRTGAAANTLVLVTSAGSPPLQPRPPSPNRPAACASSLPPPSLLARSSWS